MKVSIFERVISNTQYETDLDDIVRIMTSSQRLRSQCEEYRTHIKNGNLESASIIKMKRIPAFIPSAIMYGGKKREDVVGLTDLCFLDIDHISEEEIEAAKAILKNDSHVVLMARSISNEGLHFIIRYAFKDKDQPRTIDMTRKKLNYVYCSAFQSLCMHYEAKLNLTMDKYSCSMEKLFTLSYDEDTFYNKEAKPIVLRFGNRKGKKPYKILEY